MVNRNEPHPPTMWALYCPCGTAMCDNKWEVLDRYMMGGGCCKACGRLFREGVIVELHLTGHSYLLGDSWRTVGVRGYGA